MKHISKCGFLRRLKNIYYSMQLQRLLKNGATETPRTDIGAGKDVGDMKEEEWATGLNCVHRTRTIGNWKYSTDATEEDSNLLGRYAILSGNSLPRYRQIILPSSSGKNSLSVMTGLLILNAKPLTVLRIFGNSLPVYTVSHTGILKYSAASMWDFQISHDNTDFG